MHTLQEHPHAAHRPTSNTNSSPPPCAYTQGPNATTWHSLNGDVLGEVYDKLGSAKVGAPALAKLLPLRPFVGIS